MCYALAELPAEALNRRDFVPVEAPKFLPVQF